MDLTVHADEQILFGESIHIKDMLANPRTLTRKSIREQMEFDGKSTKNMPTVPLTSTQKSLRLASDKGILVTSQTNGRVVSSNSMVSEADVVVLEGAVDSAYHAFTPLSPRLTTRGPLTKIHVDALSLHTDGSPIFPDSIHSSAQDHVIRPSEHYRPQPKVGESGGMNGRRVEGLRHAQQDAAQRGLHNSAPAEQVSNQPTFTTWQANRPGKSSLQKLSRLKSSSPNVKA